MKQITPASTVYYYIARVSDPSQVSALPAQKLHLRQYAQKMNFPWDEKYYHEFDESAHKIERAKFEKLVKAIEKEKGFCIVVFDKIDRFTRKGIQPTAVTLQNLIDDGRGELHFPGDGLILNKYSPAVDRAKMNIGTTFAQYFSDSTRDNVLRKQDELRSVGRVLNMVPLGYLNINRNPDPNGKRDSWVVVDESRGIFIPKMFDMRIAGNSYETIADILYAEGLRTRAGGKVFASVIARILKNPFYCGFIEYPSRDIFYPNAPEHPYERLVSHKTFKATQAIRQERASRQTPPNSKHFAIKKLVRCKHCDCLMSPYTAKGITYLHCNGHKSGCPNRNASASILDGSIEAMLCSVSIPATKLRPTVKLLKKLYDDSEEYSEKMIAQTQKEHAQAEEALTNLAIKLVEGSITQDIYNKTEPVFSKRMLEASERVRQSKTSNHGFKVTESYLLSLLSRIRELYEGASERLKQKLLKILVSNFEIDGEKVKINPSDLCKYLLNITKEGQRNSLLLINHSTWGE